MDHMYDRLQKKGAVMDVDGDGLFDGHKVALRLLQAEAAAAQNNFSLAVRLLKTTRKVLLLRVFKPPPTTNFRDSEYLCKLGKEYLMH